MAMIPASASCLASESISTKVKRSFQADRSEKQRHKKTNKKKATEEEYLSNDPGIRKIVHKDTRSLSSGSLSGVQPSPSLYQMNSENPQQDSNPLKYDEISDFQLPLIVSPIRIFSDLSNNYQTELLNLDDGQREGLGIFPSSFSHQVLTILIIIKLVVLCRHPYSINDMKIFYKLIDSAFLYYENIPKRLEP